MTRSVVSKWIYVVAALMIGQVLFLRPSFTELPDSHSASTSLPDSSSDKKNEEMLACLHEVLYEYLPVGNGRTARSKAKQPQIWAHHWDAGNDQWLNMFKMRMSPMPQIAQAMEKYGSCSIWEVGAHTEAQDSRDFLTQYPNCDFHAYEPIPPFFNQLNQKWAAEKRMTLHNYGLADKLSQIQVSVESLQGQSTFIAEESGGSITAWIKPFDTAIYEAGGKKPTVLHMNCEGCEWEMLPQAINSGFIRDIPVIQFGTHNYGSKGLGSRAWELCEIRNMLNKTHVMVNGVAFAWERWVLR